MKTLCSEPLIIAERAIAKLVTTVYICIAISNVVAYSIILLKTPIHFGSTNTMTQNKLFYKDVRKSPRLPDYLEFTWQLQCGEYLGADSRQSSRIQTRWMASEPNLSTLQSHYTLCRHGPLTQTILCILRWPRILVNTCKFVIPTTYVNAHLQIHQFQYNLQPWTRTLANWCILHSTHTICNVTATESFITACSLGYKQKYIRKMFGVLISSHTTIAHCTKIGHSGNNVHIKPWLDVDRINSHNRHSNTTCHSGYVFTLHMESSRHSPVRVLLPMQWQLTLNLSIEGKTLELRK